MMTLSSRIRFSGLLLGPVLLLGLGVWARPMAPRTTAEAGRYAEHPPLAHTGGFGEATCHTCHFDGPLNGGDGTLSVDGLPDTVRTGRVYPLTVRLTAEMERSGFMLSVRHPDGRQAGDLVPRDTSRVAVATPDTTAVQYAHHTLEGTALPKPDRAAWTIEWRAPAAAADSAIVHVAANAANDDASEFGDDIYTTTIHAAVTTD